MKTTFNAPWDAGVKIITMLASGILGYYILTYCHSLSHLSEFDFLIRFVLPLFLLGLGVVFMVTGYDVDSGGIVIRRLLWRRRIRREDILRVAIPSVLFSRRIGLFGIWGFCSISGLAYVRGLGFCIVAASAYEHRVVITRHHGLPIVITPSDSEVFIHAFYDDSPNVA
jgi:hypothetical protein